MGNVPSEPFDPRIAEIIKQKARKLSRHRAIGPAEREDLEQDMSIHLLRAMGEFTAGRASLATFADRVLNNFSRNLIDQRTAKRRDRRRECQMSEAAAETLKDQATDQARVDAVLDISAAIRSLPQELRSVAAMLGEHDEADAARRLGLTRSQLRHRKLLIRRHLQAAGLDPEQPDDP